MSPYRAASTQADTSPPRLVAVRPAQWMIVGTLIFSFIALVGVAILVGNARVAASALIFAVPAYVLVALRQKTRIYDNRISQGRMWKRTVLLADVRQVFHRTAATDPYGAMTAVSSAQLDEVKLVDCHGTKISLTPLEIPHALLDEIVTTTLTHAVEEAEKAIEVGGTYRDYYGVSGLDKTTLYGFTSGMTMKKVSRPLGDVTAADPTTGVAHLSDGSAMHFGHLDLVLRALLRKRGLVNY